MRIAVDAITISDNLIHPGCSVINIEWYFRALGNDWLTNLSANSEIFSVFHIMREAIWSRHLRNDEKKKIFMNRFQGTFSVQRQFLATGSPLEVMKNAFYFT